MALKVIDIYSGSGVDMAGQAGIDGVIVKATQGTGYVNPLCNAQYALAKSKGRLLGLYHYASTNNPVTEANYFIANIKNYVGEAILALDWESYQNSAWGSTTFIPTFMNRVHELTGVWPLLYTGSDGLKVTGGVEKNCGLWFAGYPINNDTWTAPNFPYNISPWKDLTIWQFTSAAGKQDRNYAYIDAAGWKKIAKGSGTTQPSTPAPTPSYSTSGKSLETMANEVLAGKAGSGSTRTKNLGKYYASVQAIVNHKKNAISLAEANKVLAGEVKKGVLGNGDERKKLLGSYYAGTQAVVNGTSVRYYTVQSGDSFWAIQQKTGVNMYTIAKMNGMTINSVIHPGDKLKY